MPRLTDISVQAASPDDLPKPIADDVIIDGLLEHLRMTGAPDPERFRDFVAKWVATAGDLDRRIAVARYYGKDNSAEIKVDYEWRYVEGDFGRWKGWISPYLGVRPITPCGLD